MANRRMTSLDVIDTDVFLEMSQGAQNLYFHLNARADDDGFISSPRKITKVIGANEDDLRLLIAKKFIIAFDKGICVINTGELTTSFVKTSIKKLNTLISRGLCLFVKMALTH